MVYVALDAAEVLAKEGIELEVVDLRTVLPLDREAIRRTVEKTNRVIVLHEDTKTGGIAGKVAAIIQEECFDSLDAPIVRIASADSPVPFSPRWRKRSCPKSKTLCARQSGCAGTNARLANRQATLNVVGCEIPYVNALSFRRKHARICHRSHPDLAGFVCRRLFVRDNGALRPAGCRRYAPAPFERQIANKSLDEWVDEHAPKQSNPFQPTMDNIMDGLP